MLTFVGSLCRIRGGIGVSVCFIDGRVGLNESIVSYELLR